MENIFCRKITLKAEKRELMKHSGFHKQNDDDGCDDSNDDTADT